MSETGSAHHIHVREAAAADMPALFSIRTSVRENHLDLVKLAERGVTPASVAAMLDATDQRVWVAEDGNVIVALSMADARTGTVFAVFVHPSAEGRGFGRAVLRVAEDWLFEAGWEKIQLQTDEAPHTRAHRFYQAAGWELAGPADHGDVRYEKHRAVSNDSLASSSPPLGGTMTPGAPESQEV
ncbi:MAG: GNAT family N-acetyltransferase [Gemmatimonadota bacterium]|nr:GNAT family N-acetyltransferase [Gemmatimonadota bacterium]